MQHQEGFFTGVRGAKIYHQSWLPEEGTKAALLIVHGLAEHSGRYMNVVDRFIPLDYGVYGFDLPGHGRSDGARVYVKRFDDFIAVVRIYVDMVRNQQPDKPVFLIGHSMGALISTIFLLDHQSEFAGAIISGPGVMVPAPISRFTIVLAKLLSTLLPRMRVIGLDPAGISRAPAVVRAYIDDPLVYTGKITARLAYEMLKAMRRVPTEASRITLPVLIVQGGADRLVDPNGARMLYEAISSPDKTINIYDGLYHEVFNEPERDRVLGDVEAWLEAHVGH